ncbi:hypothetical protein [Winogradskyella sp. MIT101101]|uniref:hypothetical protein n=1 Tax=Winogradskyella sp. MIT101101 TaxID=3098297 RepID=UPI00399C3065
MTINKYNGNLQLINSIQELVSKEYQDLFYAILVHGSVATNEVIPYSDFDGLLIVNDFYADSKQLESFKKESMKLVCKFDPLQHHGWFQIKKSDLKNYPESYLPVSTLQHSKLIHPKVEHKELNLQVSSNVDYKTSLFKMLKQFEKRDAENWRPNNMYQLKSVLSQVMLIPCLYFSAIHNKGVFKRESFEAVKSYFSEPEWMPIKCATEIRTNWHCSLNGFQRAMFSLTGTTARKIVTRFFAPKIPIAVQKKLNEEFYGNLMILVRKIKEDVV